jgi:hypothetical protein
MKSRVRFESSRLGDFVAFNLTELDQKTRDLALAELKADVAAGAVYDSPRLNSYGKSFFVSDLQKALESGTPETLVAALRSGNKFNLTEMSHRNGTPYEKRVPTNAPSLLAEGAFVHYYVRAVCLRAIQEGNGNVTVYRARESGYHRPESDAQIGQVVSASGLLANLRINAADPALIELPDVGSGLAVHR